MYILDEFIPVALFTAKVMQISNQQPTNVM